MKPDPTTFLSLDPGNPELIGRSVVFPVGVKHLTDAQERVKPERQCTVQMSVYVVARVDREKSSAVVVGQIATRERRLRNLEIFKRVVGGPAPLSTESAERSQHSER